MCHLEGIEEFVSIKILVCVTDGGYTLFVWYVDVEICRGEALRVR